MLSGQRVRETGRLRTTSFESPSTGPAPERAAGRAVDRAQPTRRLRNVGARAPRRLRRRDLRRSHRGERRDRRPDARRTRTRLRSQRRRRASSSPRPSPPPVRRPLLRRRSFGECATNEWYAARVGSEPYLRLEPARRSSRRQARGGRIGRTAGGEAWRTREGESIPPEAASGPSTTHDPPAAGAGLAATSSERSPAGPAPALMSPTSSRDFVETRIAPLVVSQTATAAQGVRAQTAAISVPSAATHLAQPTANVVAPAAANVVATSGGECRRTSDATNVVAMTAAP